jgi:hypothetical protein
MYVRQKMITDEQFCFHVLSCPILFYHVPLTSLLSRVYRQQVYLTNSEPQVLLLVCCQLEPLSHVKAALSLYLEVFRVHLSSFPLGRTHEQIFPDQKLA